MYVLGWVVGFNGGARRRCGVTRFGSFFAPLLCQIYRLLLFPMSAHFTTMTHILDAPHSMPHILDNPAFPVYIFVFPQIHISRYLVPSH
jgi:hypothetical protein